MAGERPAFTLDAAKRGRNALPLEAWVAGAAGLAILAGAALRIPECGPVGMCARTHREAALFVSTALLAGAVAWFALPVRDDRQALLRGIGILGIAGAAMACSSLLVEGGPERLLLVAIAAGIGAPLAMLPAARPEALLEWGAPAHRKTFSWIRAGATAAFAAVAGVALGGLIASMSWSSALQVVPFWNIAAGAALLALGSALLFVFGTVEAGGDSAEARPGSGRLRLLLRMTPMQKYAFAMECALAFAGASAITAVALSGSVRGGFAEPGAALLLGGVLGALLYALLAPTVDLALGRGRLLSLAPLCAAIAILAVGASSPGGDSLALLGASALFAFAWSSAPQRYALIFDLCPSKGRQRAACDIQGAKLLVAAGAPWVYLVVEGVVSGSGLVIVSGICLLAFAIFAPTLGGLGRPQK